MSSGRREEIEKQQIDIVVDVFGKLPEDLFKPLAAEGRHFYASLLIRLYDRSFSSVGLIPRKAALLDEIEDFIGVYEKAKGNLSNEVTAIPLSATEQREMKREPEGHDTRRYSSYRYLLRCGWLIELKDKFRRTVDMSPEGRLILQEILKIATGDVRSYGGAVLSVLASLDSAMNSPDDRSEAIDNAHEHSLNFSHHLRTIATRMRQAEQHVYAQKGVASLFKVFFEDYISEFIIKDFKTLYTRNNPFRFRTSILERVVDIRANSLLIGRLAKGFVNEGRANSVEHAEAVILSRLEDIHRVFDAIDDQLQSIEETQSRISERIQTTIRFMDRHVDSVAGRITRAVTALANCPLDKDDFVPGNDHLLNSPGILAPYHLYEYKEVKKPIGQTRLHIIPDDPAVVAMSEAKKVYFDRVKITVERMRAFAHKVLDDRESIKGSDIKIETVDDFIRFQRLREIKTMSDRALAHEFDIVHLPDTVENEWMIFQDFILSLVSRA